MRRQGKSRYAIALLVAAAAVAIMMTGGSVRLLARHAPQAGATLPAPPREIPVGRPLPDLALTDDGGRRVALSALRGSPTVLLFFRGSTCPLCRSQLGALAKVATRLADAGVNVVAASPDAPATLARLRADLGLRMRLLSDADEQAVNALCGGVAHCELLTDAGGVIRWGTFSESWSHAPPPEALLAALRG